MNQRNKHPRLFDRELILIDHIKCVAGTNENCLRWSKYLHVQTYLHFENINIYGKLQSFKLVYYEIKWLNVSCLSNNKQTIIKMWKKKTISFKLSNGTNQKHT